MFAFSLPRVAHLAPARPAHSDKSKCGAVEEELLDEFTVSRVIQVSMAKLADFRTAFMLLALLLSRGSLLACSCGRIGPACEAAWKADAVFVGTAAHVDPLTIFGVPLTLSAVERHVRFTVKESFLGAKDKTIEITTGMGGGDCGIDFQRGRDYLIYAYRNPASRALYTGICTRTSYLENAGGDLAYLRSLTGNAPPARVYGFITRNAWDLRSGQKATEPLVGVPIHLKLDAREWQTTTDAAGAYDFPSLPSGTFSLFAVLPGKLGGGEPRTISLPEHGCSQQVLFGVEQAALSGRVLDDLGHPVRTGVALVPVARAQHVEPAMGYSSEDGTFTIAHIAPGDYFLGVNVAGPPREGHALSTPWQPTFYPGVQNRALAQSIHIDSAQWLQGFAFRLPPRLKLRTISGVVTWPDGKPAMAFVELKDNDFEQNNVDLVDSRRDGTLTVTGVDDRPYNISAVTSIREGATPVHSPKVDLGLSLNGPVHLVLSIPGRN